MATIYHLSCDCGAIDLDVRGRPVVSAYCHCLTCREMYGVEVLSASAWPSDEVKRRVAPGADLIAYRQAGRRMWRYHCSSCGRLVHGRNRRGYIVIPNERFRAAHDGHLPLDLAPTLHMFHEQAVLHIADELPRHAGEPENAYPESSEI